MKSKILALMLTLALLMTFALVACQPEAPVENNEAPVEGEANTEAPVEGETPAEGEEVPAEGEEAPAEDDGKIVMATNAYFQPYEYYEGDKIIGIDAEIAEAIAAKLGKTLEIADMQFDTILTAVQEGSVDFGMAGMTVTEERLESVNFTSSYASGVQSIIVKEGSPIASVDDLYAEGVTYKVGVQLGTTGDIYSTDDSALKMFSSMLTATKLFSLSQAVPLTALSLTMNPQKHLLLPTKVFFSSIPLMQKKITLFA